MSQPLLPTVPQAPTATQTATSLLATMAALTGVVTDYNAGSQVRTQAESIGGVFEMQGVGVQALVLQTLVYGAMSLFGILPSGATAATGIATFTTSLPVSGAPASTQAVAIPAGILFQSQGGIQFTTTAASTLASGASAVSVGAVCLAAGAVGNIPSGAVAGLPLSSLGYPLFVTNQAPFTGGANAEPISSTLARFSAATAALGRASPLAVANALIGFAYSGTGEVVRYSTCYEPWIAAGSGAGSGTAGFTVYADNGTGSASSGLLAAALGYLMGSSGIGQDGYRPAGVPFGVSGVVPVYATVVASGMLVPGIVPSDTVEAAAASGIAAYFGALGFNVPAQQPLIAGAFADAGLGLFQSMSVSLYYSGSATPVAVVTGTAPGNRIILSSLTVLVGP